MKTVNVTVLVAAGALCLVGGCRKNAEEAMRGEKFPLDSEQRSVRSFAEAQAASGARADATLRAYHFNGPELNSLGRAKLELMLKDDEPAEPLLVYLDVPAGYPLGEKWRGSALQFLKDQGLTEQQVRFEAGGNTVRSVPAEDSIRGLEKLRSGPDGAPAGGAEGSGGGDGGAPAPTGGGL